MQPKLRVLVIGSHDSFVKAALAYGALFEAHGAQVTRLLVRPRRGALSTAQEVALGLPPGQPSHALSAILTREHLDADIIVACLDGLHTRQFTLGFHRVFAATPRKRPLLAFAYPGILFRMHLEGMQSRSGADLLLLNSRHDLRLYESFRTELGASVAEGICAGLPFLAPRRSQREAPGGPRPVITFFGQPNVPGPRPQREFVLHELRALAARHPHAEVVLKPRARRGDRSLHADRFHYETLALQSPAGPPNFHISYEPVGELMRRSSLCLSVSSTALVEAVTRGIPTRAITDLGIHEALGNHFFLGSGLLASLRHVTPESPFVLHERWASEHLCSTEEQFPQVLARMEEVRQRIAEGAIPPSQSRALLGLAPAYHQFAHQHGAGDATVTRAWGGNAGTLLDQLRHRVSQVPTAWTTLVKTLRKTRSGA